MTVLPGSLDYLYYNGVLDHIPYEAYEMPIINNNPTSGIQGMSGMPHSGMGSIPNNPQYGMGLTSTNMNASQYLDMASRGSALDYNSRDTFVKRNSNNITQGCDNDLEVGMYGQEGKNIRQSITESAKSTADKISNAPTFIKGMLAGGIMIGTLICLLKGKKSSSSTTPINSGFWSKLNPLKWFKK